MNAFTQAHALTKQVIQAGDNYAATFALCLKQVHQEAKPMTEAQKLVAYFIQTTEARIAELKAFEATNPTGFVVISTAVGMALKFEGDKVRVINIEAASTFEQRIADAMARKVRNGAGMPIVVKHISTQIADEIADKLAHIETLKTAK